MSSQYPAGLQKIINFFEMLPPAEVRASLISYSQRVKNHLPPEGVEMDITSVRKDAECEDTVGVYLKFDEAGRVRFYIETGPQVQTLTNALACILCEAFSDETPQVILDLPNDFVPRIVGGQLFRQRSQTVYYVLRRMKEAVKEWSDANRRVEIALARAVEENADREKKAAEDTGGS